MNFLPVPCFCAMDSVFGSTAAAPCFGALLAEIWRLPNLIIQCTRSSGLCCNYSSCFRSNGPAESLLLWWGSMFSESLLHFVGSKSECFIGVVVSKQCCRIEQSQLKECYAWIWVFLPCRSSVLLEQKGIGWFAQAMLSYSTGSLAPALSLLFDRIYCCYG